MMSLRISLLILLLNSYYSKLISGFQQPCHRNNNVVPLNNYHHDEKKSSCYNQLMDGKKRGGGGGGGGEYKTLSLTSLNAFSDDSREPYFIDVVTNNKNSKNTFSNNDELILSQQGGEKSVEEGFTIFQMVARILPIATIGAYLVSPQPLDDAVAQLWSTILTSSSLVHAPLFEAEVASFGFFLWIVCFSSLHLLLGPEKTKENRLDGQMPYKPFEWAQPQNFQLWFNPLAGYLGSIWLFHQVHEKAPLPIDAPTFGIMCADLFFGIWLYDLLFYPIHYLLHKTNSGPIRKAHAFHHRMSGNKHALNSLETVQHSYADAFLQVSVNIIVQNISPFGGTKHALTRILHNLFVTYLLAESHSGYDLPWMSHRIWPEFLGGAPRHDAHHHDGKVCYHQYFKYIDDYFQFLPKPPPTTTTTTTTTTPTTTTTLNEK